MSRAHESLESLLRRLSLDPATIDARGRHVIAYELGLSGRNLTTEWWHGDDPEQVIDAMNACLEKHELDVRVDEAHVVECTKRLLETMEDEEQVRRHQIGLLALEANGALEALGSAARFRCFDPSLAWETDEPAWLLVEPAERALLAGIFGGPKPDGIEAAYDGVSRLEDAPHQAEDSDPAPLSTGHAVNAARDALREGRFNEALAAADIGVDDPSHGILAELVRINALMHMNRRDEAQAAWADTAERWLSGERAVWDTQWAELARLHGVLGLPDDDLGRRVKGQR